MCFVFACFSYHVEFIDRQDCLKGARFRIVNASQRMATANSKKGEVRYNPKLVSKYVGPSFNYFSHNVHDTSYSFGGVLDANKSSGKKRRWGAKKNSNDSDSDDDDSDESPVSKPVSTSSSKKGKKAQKEAEEKAKKDAEKARKEAERKEKERQKLAEKVMQEYKASQLIDVKVHGKWFGAVVDSTSSHYGIRITVLGWPEKYSSKYYTSLTLISFCVSSCCYFVSFCVSRCCEAVSYAVFFLLFCECYIC